MNTGNSVDNYIYFKKKRMILIVHTYHLSTFIQQMKK